MDKETKQAEELDNEFLVPFFKTASAQIKFESIYILFFVIACSLALLVIQIGVLSIDHSTKVYLFSVIGGSLGGWAYMVKWFYRAIGRGKDRHLRWVWESTKLYWRVFVPILSGISSLALFTLAVSGTLPFIFIKQFNAASSFGFSFLSGYFIDVIFSKLATWIEKSWIPENVKADDKIKSDN